MVSKVMIFDVNTKFIVGRSNIICSVSCFPKILLSMLVFVGLLCPSDYGAVFDENHTGLNRLALHLSSSIMYCELNTHY